MAFGVSNAERRKVAYACWDEQLRLYDAGSVALFAALRTECDLKIAANYSPLDWGPWMLGEPGVSGFDRYLPYQEDLGCTVSDGACAVEGEQRKPLAEH